MVLINIEILIDYFLTRISIDFIVLFSIKYLSNNLIQTLYILLDFFLSFSICYKTLFSLIIYTLFSFSLFNSLQHVPHIFIIFFWNKKMSNIFLHSALFILFFLINLIFFLCVKTNQVFFILIMFITCST